MGSQAIVDFWEALVEQFEDQSREIERLVERDDRLLSSACTRWRGEEPAGYRSTCAGVLPSTCASGKISRVDISGQLDEALKAVGLEE